MLILSYPVHFRKVDLFGLLGNIAKCKETGALRLNSAVLHVQLLILGAELALQTQPCCKRAEDSSLLLQHSNQSAWISSLIVSNSVP